MSTDTVDLLHAAEDHIGVLEAQIFQVWMALNFPPDESASDTFDRIASVMEAHGWTGLPGNFTLAVWESMNDDEDIESISQRWPRQWEKLLDKHTPRRYTRFDCGCQTGDFDDCHDTCGCPCGHAYPG